MEDVIISVDILPEVLHRRIRGDKVKVQEADGVISLIPLEKPFSDITLASERVLAKDWLLPEEDVAWQNL